MKTNFALSSSVFTLFFLLFINTHILAQWVDPIVCNEPFPVNTALQNLSVKDSRNGLMHTPKGNLHILVVYVGFTEMQNSSYDQYNSVDGWWKYNEIPDYAKGASNKVLNQDASTIGSHLNLSYWYKTMSNGTFILTGEVIQQLIIVNKLDAFGNPRPESYINDDVLNQIENLYPNKNWAVFDQRKNNPFYQFDNSLYSDVNQTPASGDGVLDYVEIVYKDGSGWSGYSGISFQPQSNTLVTSFNNQTTTYTVRDGFTSLISQNLSRNHNVFFGHEFSHNLFENPHTFGANDAVGNHLYQQGGWGMTGYFFAPFWMANAWEKWYLGWNTPQLITANGIYELSDYLTDNDALRIELPGTGGTQFLWVENHSFVNDFDLRYIGQEELPETSPGLYMFISSIGHNHNGPVQVTPRSTNSMKLLHADGNYDFRWNGQTQNGERVFEKGLSNPLSGINYCVAARQSNFNTYPGDIKYQNGSQGNVEGENEQYRIVGELVNGTPVMTHASKGDSRLPFDVGDEIGLSGIVPALPYINDQLGGLVDNNPFIDPEYWQYLRVRYPAKTYLNGLTLRILGYNSTTHKYTLQVLFDDFVVKQNKRWCGNIELGNINSSLNEPDLKITQNATVTIDKSGTANVTNEQDPEISTPTNYLGFVAPTIFTNTGGAWLQVENGSKLIVDNGSTLRLNATSKLELQQGAELYVRNGGVLEINEQADLFIQNGGRIVIENGARMVYKGGNLWLNGSQANLEVLGTLEIAEGKQFDYNHTGVPGLIRFENSSFEQYNVIGKGRVVFAGSSNTVKRVEVSGNAGIYSSLSVNLFELNNVQVLMDENAAMHFDCPVNLLNTTVDASGAFKHEGIYINGVNHQINGLSVENAYNGITWTSIGQIPNFVMRNSYLKHCATGLRTYGGSADLDRVYIQYNDVGWLADGMETASRMDRCIVNQNIDGVIYVGASPISTLGSKYSSITQNTNGVFVRYSVFAPGCGNIANNLDKGVTLNRHASLNLDPNTNKFTGNMNISANDKTITGNNTGALYLNNGNSNLAANTPDWALFAVGQKSFVANPLPAKGNYWDILASPPQWYINYQLFNTALLPITVPQTGYLTTLPTYTTVCYNYTWSNPSHTAGLMDYVHFSDAQSISFTASSMPGVSTLFEATMAVLDTLYFDSLGNNVSVIPLCKDVITYNYQQQLNTALPAILFIYDRMLEAYGKGVLESQHTPYKQAGVMDGLLQQILDVQNHLLLKISSLPDWHEARFRISLDQVMVYRLAGMRDEALDLLDEMLLWSTSEDGEDIIAWECRIQAEKDLLNGQISRPELFSFIETCGQNPLISRNPKTIYNHIQEQRDESLSGELENPGIFSSVQNDFENNITLYPNPANDIVALRSSTKSNVINIRITDMTGRIVIERPFNQKQVLLDISLLSSGCYLVYVKTDSSIEIKRLSVVK